MAKKEWKGHPLNTSDVGYDDDFYTPVIPSGSTGPYNPVVTETPKVEE